MSEVERLTKEVKSVVSAHPEWDNWRAKVDALIEAVRQDHANRIADDPKVLARVEVLMAASRNEALFECDSECRKLADGFYRESLSKDPDTRLQSRYQHDGASACVDAIRELTERTRNAGKSVRGGC